MVRRLPIFVLSLVAALCSAPALADELVLTNGDKLTGRITRVGDGRITIESPYFGTLTTELRNVQSFAVEPVPPGATTTAAAATQPATAPATAPSTIASAATQPAPAGLEKPPAAAPPKRWSGSVVASAAISRGNSNTEGWKVTADATRKGDNNTLTLNAGYAYEQQKDNSTGDRNTTVDNWFGQAKLDHNLSERWYDYALVRVERDNVANLDIRVSPGVGAGYRWILKPDEHFNTEAGVNWVYESYENDGSREHFAVRLAYHWDKKLNDKVSLVHNLEYLPNIVDPGDYNLNTDLGLRAMLTGKLFAEFKAEWRRDSTPAPGAEKNDLRYTVGVGFNF